MADVFISYKREERAQVERIAERLKGLGLSVWFDSRLPSGESFDEEINREVHAAKCVLVCWSPGAVQSQWVRAEAAIGRERDVLATVTLAPTRLYPPFNLIHTIDLSKWDGRDSDPAWLATIGRIGALADRPDLVERAGKYAGLAGADLTKPKKSLLGLWLAIAAVLALVGVGGLYVAQRYAYQVEYLVYDVVIRDLPPGLARNSPVYFNGIEVGVIDSVRIDPDDTRLVVIRLAVTSDVPVRADSTVSIVTVGGGSGLNISAGTPESEMLRQGSNGPVPRLQLAGAAPAPAETPPAVSEATAPDPAPTQIEEAPPNPAP